MPEILTAPPDRLEVDENRDMLEERLGEPDPKAVPVDVERDREKAGTQHTRTRPRTGSSRASATAQPVTRGRQAT